MEAETVVRITRSLGHDRYAVELRARSVRSLDCPRREGWGPSCSVNEVRGPFVSDGTLTKYIEIEMQSGDVIVIAAEAFSIEATRLVTA